MSRNKTANIITAVKVKKEILEYHNSHKGQHTIYCFSAWLLGKILIYDLYPLLKGNTMMDLGSVWDVYCGENTRRYHPNIPQEIILKNIKE
jgi:hypothetical protein